MSYRDPRGRRSKERPDLVINEVALDAKITPGYVCAILKGKKVPSMAVATRLAKALKLSGVDELREQLVRYQRRAKRRIA